MDLKKELEKRADIFNKQMRNHLQDGHPKNLYDAAKHLPFAGGKRLRPVLSMVSCEATGGSNEKVMPLAVAMELIHSFTLVHDDIMDKADLRRNRPTVQVEYDEPTAILAGDLLFTKGFEILQELEVSASVLKRIEKKFINLILRICEGQQLDMDFEDESTVTEEEYLEMINRKTALFFQFAAESGGIIGGGTPSQVKGLKEFGKNLGMAFQIQDDYLDMSSDAKTLGKDIGNDIRNGKKPLIVVHSLNNAYGEDKDFLKKTLGNKKASNRDVEKVFELFKKIGSIEYAKKTALEYNKKAKQRLKILDDSKAKKILLKLADFSIERQK